MNQKRKPLLLTWRRCVASYTKGGHHELITQNLSNLKVVFLRRYIVNVAHEYSRPTSPH